MSDTAQRRLDRIVWHALDERVTRNPSALAQLRSYAAMRAFADEIIADYPTARATIDACSAAEGIE